MKELCRHTLERVYLYLDGEVLSEAERIEISVHLEECGPCLERYGLEEGVTVMIQRLKTSTRCPDSLKGRIADLLDTF
jgi:mycothiol system anti-sigma-R factor